MYLRPFLLGAATYIPGIARVLERKGTGGTNSARYCYDVWLKHLTLLWAHGMRRVPHSLAELGPGDSLGVGLAAMLCGVKRYCALDVIAHSNVPRNIAIFDDLVTLLRTRAPRSTKGWPDYDDHLDDRLFPSHILTDTLLEETLAPQRVQRIRDLIARPAAVDASEGLSIRYVAPWSDPRVIEPESLDVIVSHAVLQSVRDLDQTYRALSSWLRPGGRMSHQIDFTSFRTARRWNGHWSYSEPVWKLIVGRRAYLINRKPHSVHIGLLRKHGFQPVCDLKNVSMSSLGVPRSQLAARWRHLSDDDLACSGAFIQAVKLASPRPTFHASN